MIMFTGSTATGKKVMAKAAETLTPVSLELGGKDPMVVLADADVERAANAAVYYAMLNGGQTCVSVERVYVEAPVYDDFVAKVTEKARALRNDRSTGPGTADVGSMTFPPQVDIVERHVRDAVDKGARVVVGGERGHDGQGGYWFEPTVLVDVDHTMDCMREETFGPTLPIMKVADAEEAIRLANDSPYGLGGAVFSKDVARGEAVARRIEAGAVCVNDSNVNYTALELPMGGAKASGLGSRHGADGIRKYTQQQALLISRVHPKRDLHMYPYSARMTGRPGQARPRPLRTRQARPVALRGVRRRRPAEPREHGPAQEAPVVADLAARELARVGQGAHGVGVGLQQLGRLLDGQHLGRRAGHELGAADDHVAVGPQRQREGGRRRAVPQDVGVVEALGHQPAHDVALGDPPLEGETIELLGLLEGEADEEGRGVVVAALALLGHAPDDSSWISGYPVPGA